MRASESVQAGQLDDCFYAILKKNRQNNNVMGNGFEQARANRNRVAGQIGDQHAPFFESALSDKTFSNLDELRMTFSRVRKRREKGQVVRVVRLHLIENTLLRIHQG